MSEFLIEILKLINVKTLCISSWYYLFQIYILFDWGRQSLWLRLELLANFQIFLVRYFYGFCFRILQLFIFYSFNMSRFMKTGYTGHTVCLEISSRILKPVYLACICITLDLSDFLGIWTDLNVQISEKQKNSSILQLMLNNVVTVNMNCLH